MRLILPSALLALAALASSACDDGAQTAQPTPTPTPEIAQSALARDLTPEVPAADLEAAVAGNTAFAFDLYRELSAEPGNLLFSPHSVSIAMAMAWSGAVGTTADELAGALHYDLPGAQLHPAFNALDLALSSRGQGALGADGEPFRLRVVNAAWAQAGYPFLAPYLDTLALHYGAGVRLVDFAEATEAARQTINGWVSEQTEARIPELLSQGAVDPSTRFVLTNAVYFNAAWEFPFDADNTAPGAFTRLDGSTVQVPLMREVETHPYAAANGWMAVELPYDGGEVAILIATADDFATFEAGLDEATVAAIDGALAPTYVDLRLPKFEYRTSAQLVPALSHLGVSAAFGPGADFSAMDGTRDLVISGIIHQAFIKLDEEGTEAAAATAVVFAGTSVPPEPVAARFDRPFVYLIRDVATGAVLFVGRVVDPTL